MIICNETSLRSSSHPFVIASDSSDKDGSNSIAASWSAPHEENEAYAYIQRVQDFWTDERLVSAAPKPMTIDASSVNNGQLSVSKKDIKK